MRDEFRHLSHLMAKLRFFLAVNVYRWQISPYKFRWILKISTPQSGEQVAICWENGLMAAHTDGQRAIFDSGISKP